MIDTRLAAVQLEDIEARKIISERPVVITVRGNGLNTSEVIYEDRWGNQFKTWVSYKA